jgi:subtilisin family serine protease
MGRGWRLAMPFLAMLLLLGNGPGATSVARATGAGALRAAARYVPGVLLVRRKAGASAEAVTRQAKGAAVAGRVDALGVDKVTVPPGQEQAISRQLEQSGLVEFAQPDFLYRVADVTPNDPDYPQQWDLPKIRAPAAWGTTEGSPGVIVAVIDTGYDLGHPDRPVNLIAGPTYTQNSAPYDGCGPEGVDGPSDDFGHGTHVGGTIAADFNNGVGMAGLAPNVSLLVIKAGDCAGYFADSDIVSAIDYAVNNGAKVINMSFGGPGPDDVMGAAVQGAARRGVVLVAAAGNDASSENFVPADLSGVMAIAATDPSDQPAYFSNYGPAIAVAAPGVNILSTYPTSLDPSGYLVDNGTSMASPHVAAIAGLVLSAFPALSAGQVISAIERGAVPLGGSVPNAQYGYGRVDACNALYAAGHPSWTASLPASSPSPTPTGGFHVYLPLIGVGCA